MTRQNERNKRIDNIGQEGKRGGRDPKRWHWCEGRSKKKPGSRNPEIRGRPGSGHLLPEEKEDRNRSRAYGKRSDDCQHGRVQREPCVNTQCRRAAAGQGAGRRVYTIPRLGGRKEFGFSANGFN